ncbi:hypothetical protein [Desulfobacula toluolica]|uniref:Conserved uncharacterized protein n=1 Tax=Desulfobacula toluolica (strain DSM 7467 / Tol2) TaxID=651182 RepID=K0NNY9_DESTT|nr:hypothetical protein [Desulfobacula toluolica]CCK82385.1 conserved uncharacterized protein [Desulfobacula toluolica Tol2]
MKTFFKSLIAVFFIAFFSAGAVFAGDTPAHVMQGHDMKAPDMKDHGMKDNHMQGHDMKVPDMKDHGKEMPGRFGDLIHESVVDGYTMSYYFMDMRDMKNDTNDKDSMDMDKSKSHGMAQMDKPHHIMVYLTDQNHTPVLKGKVGFVIKDARGKAQKIMGMFMSNGFGATADMKKKGVYTITTKAVLGNKKLMDRFDYEIK